jgi:NADPH-dependent curcumin reductase CurA
MQGFNGMDHWGKHAEISADIAKWMEEGKIRVDETILEGLDEAWRSVNMLFTGENIGKLLVHVADN